MVKYESPLGNKQMAGGSAVSYSVSDETGYQQQMENQPLPFDQEVLREFNASQPQRNTTVRELTDVEKQIFNAKKAKREGKERLSEGAKRRVEMLIGMIQLTKDVDIEGNLFRLQTLRSKELREALVATAEYDGSIQFIFETRKQLLARSLVVVAGVEIEQFLNSTDLQDRLDFVEEMDHSLLLRLYNEYVLLSQEAEQKYAIKTEQQVKEVLEDLKK